MTNERPGRMTIGDLIKSSLKAQSLSMRKLGEHCGLDPATVSRIASGKQQPKLQHLKLLSEHLNVPLERLIAASGFEAEAKGGLPEAPADIFRSLDAIRDWLGASDLFDPETTTKRIEQELAKYEQYAQTEEGHRMICEAFDDKLSQVNGVGPFIDQLRIMHDRYRDPDTSSHDRFVLGSALLYFILSTDIIPDYMFPIGYLDDAIAVRLVMDRLNLKDHSA